MPLLFSLYWLMPSVGAARHKWVDWVIIEEPEMGVHPQAIQSVLLKGASKKFASPGIIVPIDRCWLLSGRRVRVDEDAGAGESQAR